MNIRFRSQLTRALERSREIVRYYRTGPLGDVAAANGKIVEEAMRKMIGEMAGLPVTTSGLVDLGVSKWHVGFQVKTFRTKADRIIFARSNKIGKAARIADIRTRIVSSLDKTDTEHLVLMDYDMFSSNVNLYHLASVIDGEVVTYGSFLSDATTSVSQTDTHFRICKKGLVSLGQA
jgi:hypothetical protein